MIPLVLGLGATFVILMGSIDLSVEGVLTLGAVILRCLLVLNGANGNDLGLLGIAGRAGWSARRWASSTASSTSGCASPPSWRRSACGSSASGLANALLGGIAVRINDPMIRGLAIERVPRLSLGRLAGARCRLASPTSSRTTRGSAATSTRLGGGEELAALSGIPVRARAHRRLHAGRRLLRARRRPGRGAARPRQRPDRQRPPVHHHHRRRRRRHRRSPAARAACCRRWSAC